MFLRSKWYICICIITVLWFNYLMICHLFVDPVIIVNEVALSNTIDADYNLMLHDMNLSTNDCDIYKWKLITKGANIINCTSNSTTNDLTIAIASFHYYVDDYRFTIYEQMILQNHISYVIKHKYIYFDVSSLLFNNLKINKYFNDEIRNDQDPHPMFKAQKSFIISSILSDKIFGNSIDYVLWIDFDAIFFNCSKSLQQILHYTQHIYSKFSDFSININNSMDIIFSKDYSRHDLLNAGAILYKNTNWTMQLLLKQTHMFKHADKFKLAPLINQYGLVDQLLWAPLLVGYDPLKYPFQIVAQTLNQTISKYRAIFGEIPNRYINSSQISDLKHRAIQNNPHYSIFIHDNYLGTDVMSHSAIIPQIHINMLQWQWRWTQRHSNRYNKDGRVPFILHFNGINKKFKIKKFIQQHHFVHA
eukprot:341455_1